MVIRPNNKDREQKSHIEKRVALLKTYSRHKTQKSNYIPIALASILLVCSLFVSVFYDGGITGFLGFNQGNEQAYLLNETFIEDSIIDLSELGISNFTSLKLTGYSLEHSNTTILLEVDGKEYLVYAQGKNSDKSNLITGFAVFDSEGSSEDAELSIENSVEDDVSQEEEKKEAEEQDDHEKNQEEIDSSEKEPIMEDDANQEDKEDSASEESDDNGLGETDNLDEIKDDEVSTKEKGKENPSDDESESEETLSEDDDLSIVNEEDSLDTTQDNSDSSSDEVTSSEEEKEDSTVSQETHGEETEEILLEEQVNQEIVSEDVFEDNNDNTKEQAKEDTGLSASPVQDEKTFDEEELTSGHNKETLEEDGVGKSKEDKEDSLLEESKEEGTVLEDMLREQTISNNISLTNSSNASIILNQSMNGIVLNSTDNESNTSSSASNDQTNEQDVLEETPSESEEDTISDEKADDEKTLEDSKVDDESDQIPKELNKEDEESNLNDNTTTISGSLDVFALACVETCSFDDVKSGKLIVRTQGSVFVESITYGVLEEKEEIQDAPDMYVAVEDILVIDASKYLPIEDAVYDLSYVSGADVNVEGSVISILFEKEGEYSAQIYAVSDEVHVSNTFTIYVGEYDVREDVENNSNMSTINVSETPLTNASLNVSRNNSVNLSLNNSINNLTNNTDVTVLNQTNVSIILNNSDTSVFVQERAVVGQPVKWKAYVKGDVASIEIPQKATDIEVFVQKEQGKERLDEVAVVWEDKQLNLNAWELFKEEGETANEEASLSTSSSKNIGVKGKGSGRLGTSALPKENKKPILNELDNITVVINQTENSTNETIYEVVYETAGPEQFEKELSVHKKEVTISSPYHYKEVETSASLPYEARRESIQLVWKQEHEDIVMQDITYYDDDSDGLIERIGWVVPHLSNQTFEISIVVLNVQSYPIVGGTWIVEFNTTGQANLSISASNGTTYGNALPDDLIPISLYCGNQSVAFNWSGNDANTSNYSCDNETSYWTVKVLTPGKHTQGFRFGNLTAYAFNDASGPVTIKNVQSGSVVLAEDAKFVEVTIDSVNTSSSFLSFSTSLGFNEPECVQLAGSLEDSTTIRFEIHETDCLAQRIVWYVAEFESGVLVQHNNTVISGSTNNVGIRTTDVDRSFPLMSMRMNGNDYDDDDGIRANITSSTNLRFSLEGSGSSQNVESQTIQMTGADVQTGLESFGSGADNITVTVNSINMSRSLITYSVSHAAGTSSNIAEKVWMGRIVDSTTIEFSRGGTGVAGDLQWQLTEFANETYVIHDTTSFGTTTSQVNVTIPQVSLSRTIPIGGQFMRGGKTDYSSDDNLGVAWFTLELTNATNLQITRNATASSTSEIGWFVITFNGTGQTQPIYTEFGSANTTNFGAEVDLNSITNPVIQNDSYVQIEWNGVANVEGENFDSAINFSTGWVVVNSSDLNSTLNTSANITLYDLPFTQMPVVYRDGVLCTNECSRLSYVNNDFLFNVSHFTNYSAGSNSELTIWDQKDAAGGNHQARASELITFYANYTNITSSQSIATGSCNISFNDSMPGPYVMHYQSSSSLYEYNRSFAQGTFSYNITCADPANNYENLSVNDTLFVTENERLYTQLSAMFAGSGSQHITLNFEPEVIFFWMGNSTMAGQTYGGIHSRGWYADGAQGSVGVGFANDTTHASTRILNDSVLTLINGTGAILAQARVNKTNATGFELEWTVEPPNTPFIYALSLAGSDLTSAKAGSFIYPAGGTHNITDVNFGADTIFFMGVEEMSSFGSKTDGGYAYGVTLNASKKYSTSFFWNDSDSASNASSSGLTTAYSLEFARDVVNTQTAIDVNYITDIGFNLSQDIDNGHQAAVNYLAIKGLFAETDVITQPSSTGVVRTKQTNFTPDVLLFDGGDSVGVDTYEDDAESIFGVYVGTSTFSIYTGVDPQYTSNPKSETHFLGNQVIRSKDITDQQIDAIANVSSTHHDGFSLNWSVADSTARRTAWLALSTRVYEAPIVTLLSPLDASSQSPTITFESAVIDMVSVVNASLYTNRTGTWQLEETRWAGEYAYNDSGLIALYHFNNETQFGENASLAYDFSGMGNNATCAAGECPTHLPNGGRFGGAFNFSGNGSMEHFDINDTIDYITGANGTYSFWIRREFNDSVLTHQPVISIGVNSTENIFFRYVDGLDRWEFNYDRAGTGVTLNISASLIPQDTWTFVVLTWNNASDEIKGYVNGNLIDTKTGIAGFRGDMRIAYLGRQGGTAPERFQGQLDEVGIWNRTLSDAEALALYNTSLTTFTPIFQDKTFANGHYMWNVLAYDVDNYTGWAPSNFTFTVAELPIVSLDNPQSEWIVNSNPYLECSATTNGGSLSSITLFTNESGSWSSYAVNTSVSGSNDSATFSLSGLGRGRYVWNCQACDSLNVCNSYNTSNATFIVDNQTATVNFGLGTPANNTKKKFSENTVLINVSSNDAGASSTQSVFLDWDNTLIGWWSFDSFNSSLVYDNSTYASSGNLSNGAYISEAMFGKGVSLDGINDYVNMSEPSSADQSFSELTLEAWIQYEGNVGSVVGKGDVWNLKILDATTVAFVYTGVDTGNTTVSVSDLTDGWHHVVAVFNQSNTAVYVDGVYRGGNSFGTTNLDTNNEPLLIGAVNASPVTHYFNGSIDEVRIHSRALSHLEVNASFNASTYSYLRNFTTLTEGATYTYKAYTLDLAANSNATQMRIFTVNTRPTLSNVILNSTFGSNLTTENITAHYTDTDGDGDTLTVITDWRENGTSLAVFNLPFDTNISDNSTDAVKDYSTYGNNATLGENSSTMPIWTTVGKVGGGYDFDGVDDYIFIEDSPDVDLNSTFTIEVWVNSRNASRGGSDLNVILAKWQSSNGLLVNYHLALRPDGRVRYRVSNYSGTEGTNTDSATSLSDNVWYHIVATFENGNTSMYVNGARENSKDTGFDYAYTNNADIHIGRFDFNWIAYEHHFNGYIDQVRLYNRTLHETQIKEHYERELGNYSLNTIVSSETSVGENFSAELHANDGYDDSIVNLTNTLIIRDVVNYWICATENTFNTSACWSKGTVPVQGEDVVFNGSGIGNANITNGTLTQELNSFIVEPSYTGNIRFESLFADGNWTGANTGDMHWNVTGLINISGGTLWVYADYPHNISVNGHGQIWESITSEIIIGKDASVRGDALGFSLQEGPGYVANTGGSHGGRGGSASAGVYGDQMAPTSIGSGGESSAGGSAVKLVSTNQITVRGVINVSGQDVTSGGSRAGAGGSIWLYAPIIRGNGSLYARGGVGVTDGGGAGRVAFTNTSTLNFSGNIYTDVLSGSTNRGSGGTAYLYSNALINTSLNITSVGAVGGNITFNDTLVHLRGVYNASGESTDGNITVSYTDCSSNFDLAVFDPNAEFLNLGGCNVAPNTPVVSINSTDGSNLTAQDLHCIAVITDDNADDLNVTARWFKNGSLHLTNYYNNSYTNGTAFFATLNSTNTSKYENWSCSLRLDDSNFVSSFGNSTNLTINNTGPTIPVLDYPNDGDAFFTNRTPRYNWSASIDDDNDTINYTIHVSLTSDFSTTILNETNFSTNYYDQPTELDFAQYFWRVRSYDGENYSNWSTTFNFTLVRSVIITLVNSSVDFGSLFPTDTDNTTDNNPFPLHVRNDGNYWADLVNASANQSLFASASLDTPYWQFKADNTSAEPGAFNSSGSLVDWVNVTSTNQSLISTLNYTDNLDEAEIDIRIEVPPTELPGSKSSYITLRWEESPT